MNGHPREIIYGEKWRPHFYKDFAGFYTVEPFWKTVAQSFLERFPTIEDYNSLKGSLGFNFVVQKHDMQYLREITESHQIPTRLNSWHDFFNNLSWIIWPRMKTAIIKKFSFTKDVVSKNGRTPLQNWLTHFDECGVVLCCDREELFHTLKRHEWKKFFLDNKDLTKQCEMYIIGHGMLEKSLSPYIGMTGKAVFLNVSNSFFSLSYKEKMQFVDDKMADFIVTLNDSSPLKPLLPFPLLGWPGIWPGNEKEEFFANRAYFRTQKES